MGSKRGRRRSCMTLPFLTSLTSIPSLLNKMAENDTLTLRNREVEETLSKTADFGCNEKYDKLELRNRTVTETLSLKDDLGQDAKEKPEKNGEKGTNGVQEFDTLELRNRTVTETLSPVADLGQDKKDNEDEPDAKKQKFDTLSLRNRDVTETLSPLDN